MSDTKLRVGGVPEHFNLPIHLARERGDFIKKGITVEWTDYPEGTGQMTKALRANETDIAFILTEGIIFDIINGNPAKIISEFVVTPLTWGIHTGKNNDLKSGDNFFEKNHAISRFGSGSHLMSIINANAQGHSLSKDQFREVGKLDQAIVSLNGQETDVFYWEKFTTKPFVDSGEIRRISQYVTPWPCFVVAASERILAEAPDAVSAFLKVVQSSCQAFMKDSSIIPTIADRYKLKLADVERWYHSTEWASNSWVSDKMIDSVIYHLKVADIIRGDEVIPEFIWKR